MALQPCLDEHLFSASQLEEFKKAKHNYVYLAGDSAMRLHSLRYMGTLGKGTFGRVYKCRVRGSTDVVAVKTMELQGSLPQSVVNEIRVMISVKSPYSVAHKASFIENKIVCIVMECLTGGTLKDFIQHCQKQPQPFHVPERLVARWGAQMADSLAELHELRLIHRDVKPANTLLTGHVYIDVKEDREDCSVKVADMGLARILSDETLLAHTKCGTPLYMAPEQLLGESGVNIGYDCKVDIWALGCVLYELITLKPPFLAPSGMLLKRAIIHSDPAAIRPEGTSEELWDVVQKCLSKQSSARPNAKDISKSLFDLEKKYKKSDTKKGKK